MNSTHDDGTWSSRFTITLGDLERVAARLERTGVPRDLKAIALPLIQGRLEHGPDSGPAALCETSHVPLIRLWDPGADWEAGDPVLIAHDRFGNSKYEPFLGEIIRLDPEAAEIRIEELQSTKTVLRVPPGMESSRSQISAVKTWQRIFTEAVKKKLQSGSLEEQAEGILLEYGEHILACLAGSLSSDPRFTGLEDKWYLTQGLPRLHGASLQAVHAFLLQDPPASLDDILPVVREGSRTDACLLKMAIHTTLQQSPERFENVGTPARPRWKALLPAPDQAEVLHYAYDPQTYEILCRPDRRLTPRQARRLQELDYYAHVVTFAEWNLAARP